MLSLHDRFFLCRGGTKLKSARSLAAGLARQLLHVGTGCVAGGSISRVVVPQCALSKIKWGTGAACVRAMRVTGVVVLSLLAPGSRIESDRPFPFTGLTIECYIPVAATVHATVFM